MCTSNNDCSSKLKVKGVINSYASIICTVHVHVDRFKITMDGKVQLKIVAGLMVQTQLGWMTIILHKQHTNKVELQTCTCMQINWGG